MDQLFQNGDEQNKYDGVPRENHEELLAQNNFLKSQVVKQEAQIKELKGAIDFLNKQLCATYAENDEMDQVIKKTSENFVLFDVEAERYVSHAIHIAPPREEIIIGARKTPTYPAPPPRHRSGEENFIGARKTPTYPAYPPRHRSGEENIIGARKTPTHPAPPPRHRSGEENINGARKTPTYPVTSTIASGHDYYQSIFQKQSSKVNAYNRRDFKWNFLA